MTNRTMLPEEFEEIGNVLFEDYGLNGWKIILHDRFDGFEKMASMAYTQYFSKNVHISLEAMQKFDYDFCLSCIRHEIAHALHDAEVFRNYITRRQKEKAHGKEWREYAFNCGIYKEDLHPYSRKRNETICKMHLISQNQE